ncbi:SDR family oxidoreductase [Aquabacterium fontiphilum]|jgi:citronellol/citronellal dehydrogenase|uniref:SDR family oxidoreductase n=1 Tax=Aquabacterium fontiphilum TaxID=450365 RepID=UPI0013781619|nr:SDR family oxidoreductase [Aquabacterium fontiphilum]NBD20372.1 SDR family oxidoreductase [Aquabacterium fontiphilum]
MNTSARYDSVFRPGLFQDRVIVVTGGGSGIGRCVAHELAALGATVVITGRNEEKLARVKAEILEDGGRVDTQAFDIRDEDQVKAAVADIVARHGAIHGLVNNAGGQFPSPMAAISKRGFDAVVTNNLTGGFLMMREVFNQAMSKTGGAIVNMTADMWNGMPGMAHSGAARAGMVNLTKTAAFEWAYAHVRVNAVAPGWIASSGMDSYGPAMAPMIRSLKDNLPMKRMGLEAEVSSVICFLLSPGAAFVTGVTVAIDGGAPLNSPVMPLAPHKGAPRYNGFHRATTPKVLGEDES